MAFIYSDEDYKFKVTDFGDSVVHILNEEYSKSLVKYIEIHWIEFEKKVKDPFVIEIDLSIDNKVVTDKVTIQLSKNNIQKDIDISILCNKIV